MYGFTRMNHPLRNDMEEVLTNTDLGDEQVETGSYDDVDGMYDEDKASIKRPSFARFMLESPEQERERLGIQ